MMKFLGLPPLATEHGQDVDRLILYVHLLMGALLLSRLLHPLGMHAVTNSTLFWICRRCSASGVGGAGGAPER